jgi:dihydrofolate reductase
MAARGRRLHVGKVFVDIGMSLDGFIAGPNGRPGNPLGDGGLAIHQWVFQLASFRELMGMAGGDINRDDEIVRAVFARAGAYVMGRRMFEEGEVGWPSNPPFRAPVFVLTHHRREPWVREGGTTFFFVTDGIDAALERAREAAGGKDVRISGGANTVQQFLRAGVVDELTIHLAPVLLGTGVKAFDHLGPQAATLERLGVIDSPRVTHLSYRVTRKS